MNSGMQLADRTHAIIDQANRMADNQTNDQNCQKKIRQTEKMEMEEEQIDDHEMQEQYREDNEDNSEAILLKDEIANEIRENLKQVQTALMEIKLSQNKDIFNDWVGEKGVINLINLCLDGDSQAWNKVLTSKPKINNIYKKRRTEKRKIAQKLDFNKIQKQNASPLPNSPQPLQSVMKNPIMSESSKDNIIDQQKENNKQKQKQYLRGPYRNYSRQMKEQMVKLYLNGVSVNQLNHKYGVPLKNIKRWAENGIDRKQGAGRKKLDPEMQDIVFKRIIEKYNSGETISEETIREWAMEQCKSKDFKASKGWLNKFLCTYQLSKRYIIL